MRRYTYKLLTIAILSCLVACCKNVCGNQLNVACDGKEEEMMPGSYALVKDANENPSIHAAAMFAVNKMKTDTTLIKLAEKYTFLPLIQDGNTPVTIKILRAFQQVVAGMNYRMLLVFMSADGTCIGSFEVTVYDQFGSLSVTTWGREIPCSDALNGLNEIKGLDMCDRLN